MSYGIRAICRCVFTIGCCLVLRSLRRLLGVAVGRSGHLLQKLLEDGLDGVRVLPGSQNGQLDLESGEGRGSAQRRGKPRRGKKRRTSSNSRPSRAALQSETYLSLASNAIHGHLALERDSGSDVGVVVAAVDRQSENTAFKSSLHRKNTQENVFVKWQKVRKRMDKVRKRSMQGKRGVDTQTQKGEARTPAGGTVMVASQLYIYRSSRSLKPYE